MNEYLRRLMGERDSMIQTATSMADAAAEAGRDLTETEQATLAGMQARGAEIDAQLATYGAQLDSQRAYADLRSHLGSAAGDGGEPRQRRQRGERAPALESRSWGEQVAASGILDRYNGFGTSERATLPGVLTRAATDPIMLANIPPAYLPAHVVEVAGAAQAFPLIGAVSREVVSVNSVEFITWLPNPVPPAAKVAEGALKPAMDVTAAPTTASLDTYAGWKAVTRQTLEDFPRIQSIVEGKLQQSLLARASAEIATLMAAATPATATGGTLNTAIRAAIGQLQGSGYTPNAVALNPSDWAAIDVAALDLNNPNPGFWGLTPLAAPEIPVGKPVVGDFKAAITLFDRNQTSVFITDSHADFFLRNQLVILAEARMLAAAVEPGAMVAAAVAVGP